MERFSILPIVLAIAAVAAACLPVAAQSGPGASMGQPIPSAPVEFRSYDQMTQRDRDLATGAESAIRERAGIDGMDFDQGKWNSQQVVCPALPHHLFLKFTRNGGSGDASMFSASIPRGGEGRVRIIPILRRGYSLFSPAPINAMTISAFNHILSEEAVGKAPDWQQSGLCYAALAGAHPRTGSEDEQDTPMLTEVASGGTVVTQAGTTLSFTDLSAIPAPTAWTLTFDGHGKLLESTHEAAPPSRVKVAKKTAAEDKGKTVQAAAEAAQTTPPAAAVESNTVPPATAQGEVRPIALTPAEVQGKPVQATEAQGKPILQRDETQDKTVQQ